jgi:hypothetical protein
VEYVFFSVVHGTFSKIDHIVGYKTSLKYIKIEIISSILSYYNGLKLEISSKRNYRKYTNIWRLSNILLNGQWVIEEIMEETKNS